jgi:hypothetical protein
MRLSWLAAPLVLLATTGCQGWQVQTTPPVEYVQQNHPDRIQIIRTDNTRAELFSPVLVGDSLRGLPTEKAIRPLVIPLEEVSKVAIRKFSLSKTALLLVSIGAGAIIYDQLMKLNQSQGF